MSERKLDQFPRAEPQTRADWRRWLAQNHANSGPVWLVTRRKSARMAVPDALSQEAAIEEALCFGWIDSLPRKLDDQRTMLLFTPRKPKSAWSALNKSRVARMIDAGLMTSAGRAMIDEAKATGLWDKLDPIEALETPVDLEEALAAFAGASANFNAFPRSARRDILEWIAQAKRPGTRSARVAETARLAAENRRANQWRG